LNSSEKYLKELNKDKNVKIVYAPYMQINNELKDQQDTLSNEILSYIKYANRNNTLDYFKNSKYNLQPTTDNKPFFYEFDKKHIHSKNFLYTFLFYLVLLISPLFIILKKQHIKLKVKNLIIPFAVFFILGIGFSFFQISLLQKFTIFLGSPNYSLLVIFCIFSLFAGYSGYYFRKLKSKRLIIFALILLATVILYSIFLNNTLMLLYSPSIVQRFFITSLLIIPYAIGMGVFFPTIMRFYFKLTFNLPSVLNMINILGITFGVILGAYFSIKGGFKNIELIAVVIYICIGAFYFFHKPLLKQLE